MAKIFISYRREDSPGYVGRLQETLNTKFRPSDVFLDAGHIAPGRDFAKAIAETVGECEVLLVVIGTYWLTRSGGEPRDLNSPNDYVRFEIATALNRGITVIPVLVGGASLPSAEQLPADLVPLLKRQAIVLTDSHWAADCKRLIEAIVSVVGSPQLRAQAALKNAAVHGWGLAQKIRPPAESLKAKWIDPWVRRVGRKRLAVIAVLIILGAGYSFYAQRRDAMTTDRAREYLDAGSWAGKDGFFLRITNEGPRTVCATVAVDLEVRQGRTVFKSNRVYTETWRPGEKIERNVPYDSWKGELDLDRQHSNVTGLTVSGLCD